MADIQTAPNKADTSYLNVNFSASQQAILDNDIKEIDKYVEAANAARSQAAYYDAQYNSAVNRDCKGQCGCSWHCNTSSCYSACMSQRTSDMNSYSQKRDAQNALYTSNVANANSAIEKYNNDLKSIQNSIKLQLQAQQANINAVHNSPGAVLAQNQANLELKKKELDAKIAERETTVKYVVFGVVVIVVIVAAVVVWKKWLS